MELVAKMQADGAVALGGPEDALLVVAQGIVGQDPAHAISKAMAAFAYETLRAQVAAGISVAAAIQHLDRAYRDEQRRLGTDTALVFAALVADGTTIDVAVNGAAEIVRWREDDSLETVLAPQSVAAAAAAEGATAPEWMETVSARALGFGESSGAQVASVPALPGARMVLLSRPARALRQAFAAGQSGLGDRVDAVVRTSFSSGLALLAVRV